MSKVVRPVLGITMGDPAGIGPEIIVKALADPEPYQKASLIVVGDFCAIADALCITGLPLRINRISSVSQAKGVHGSIDLFDLDILRPGCWEYKKISALCGKAAFSYVEAATVLAMRRQLDAVVTAPLSKRALKAGGYPYAGNTDIFADLTHTKDYAMLLSNEHLRVLHVTNHISLKQVSQFLTIDKVYSAIQFAQLAAFRMGVQRPRIAVCGLNPHASPGNLFGMEEEEIIVPAIERARSGGLQVEGPMPPHLVFPAARAGEFDIVVAMYHDQGHIPFMLSSMKEDPANPNICRPTGGSNSTIGLPFIRTSVDHSEMFSIAGEGIADAANLSGAIKLAIAMVENSVRTVSGADRSI